MNYREFSTHDLILKSWSELNKNMKSYYIGSTKDLKRRLENHNSGKSKFTKNRRPLQLKYTEEYDNYKLAFRREKQLKSWKKRIALERLFNKDKE